MGSPHSIAIVEDNRQLAEVLRTAVEAVPDFVCMGTWPSGEDALAAFMEKPPEVVLMDINLPGISGIETTRRLRKSHPAIHILIVTVYGDHDRIFAALEAGATGYLLKRSSMEEMEEAIRDVLAGGAPMSAEIARRVVEAFHGTYRDPLKEAHLTERETDILRLLADGLGNKAISAQLAISVETVRAHNRNIYEKLHVNSRTQAALLYRESQENSPS
ncbi:response regulator transcription factor [Roseibacillus ishigakijimensis]|uniref:Response regulator transcription factor n=1 Tax=Roseibacillus ishigakijimensis TaxID=454146 RepID=A0A934VNL9_9BACT|nr:response regulator transcription factor [Roseibacillus ishigakijimensis]MBK1835216.1 response regulator transcription factor [Roseibacillus ishigakijimensis]